MMAASLMGATAFQKGLGAMHSMSHPLGAQLHVHHGLANAIVMPYVLERNRQVIDEKMTDLARYLGLAGSGTSAILDWVLSLRRRLHIPHTLKKSVSRKSIVRYSHQPPSKIQPQEPIRFF